MKKVLIFLVGFLLGIILFAPKENLYFTLQHYLAKQNIYINSDINSNIVKLSLKEGTIYYNKMDVIKFKEINSYLFLFFDKIEANNLKLNIGNYVVTNAKLIYQIFNPTKISIIGDSNFGKIDGKIDLLKRDIKIYIKLTNNNLKSFLRKDKKGYYYYAKF